MRGEPGHWDCNVAILRERRDTEIYLGINYWKFFSAVKINYKWKMTSPPSTSSRKTELYFSMYGAGCEGVKTENSRETFCPIFINILVVMSQRRAIKHLAPRGPF